MNSREMVGGYKYDTKYWKKIRRIEISKRNQVCERERDCRPGKAAIFSVKPKTIMLILLSMNKNQ